jgi:hypothetical protein
MEEVGERERDQKDIGIERESEREQNRGKKGKEIKKKRQRGRHKEREKERETERERGRARETSFGVRTLCVSPSSRFFSTSACFVWLGGCPDGGRRGPFLNTTKTLLKHHTDNIEKPHIHDIRTIHITTLITKNTNLSALLLR